MRLERQKYMEERSTCVGDGINKAVDKCDMLRTRGLLGVVFNVGKGGGVEVVTLGGITSNGGKAFYLPINRYEVVNEESVDSVVPQELRQLHA
jgi:hypothetical protein